MIRAVHRPELDLRIGGARALVYDEGGNAFLDRPPHVRAGSGLVVIDGTAWIIQDDTLFLGKLDLATGSVHAVTLPAGSGGVRQFDDARGNKAEKLDLECVVSLSSSSLLALGSGSTAKRRRFLRIDLPSGATKFLEGDAFYAALEASAEFAGSELNLEGAILLPGKTLRLFQRGNGAPKNGREPRNATADVALDDALANRPARLANVRAYDLGEANGARLTFTDAALDGSGRVHYLAAAEKSPDTYHDGENVGCALGRIADDGSAEYGLVLEPDGKPTRRKLEGLAWDAHAARWLAVEDRDDPTRPSEMVWMK